MKQFSMNILGIEQLLICSRNVYYENNQAVIREDFLGFIALEMLNAEIISNNIISSLQP